MSDDAKVVDGGGERPVIHEAEMVATPPRAVIALPATMEPLLRTCASGVADAIRGDDAAAAGPLLATCSMSAAGLLLAANRAANRLPMVGYDEATDMFRRVLARHRLRSADFDDATTAFCVALSTNMQIAIGMGLA